jgi:uncharacterized Ntn-hydrolase superfamily protein/uncharacterized SAM-binding protein YcdF (DUF218 family)
MEIFLQQVLFLFEPIGFTWLCLVLLGFFALRRRLGRFALGAWALAFVLYYVGATGFPGTLLGTLEKPYAGLNVADLPPCDAVVMLGGGIEPSKYEAGGFHLTRAGDRVLMAMELVRKGKAPVLVVGGGGTKLDGHMEVEADLLKSWLVETKQPTPTAEVISLGHCANTHDEAERTAAIATQRGWKTLLLVTSAGHMKRASATFRTAGLQVIPAPCNFLTTVSTAPPPSLGFIVPSFGNFEKVSAWFHEQVGWYEYRRRGWIKTEAVPLGGNIALPAPPTAAHFDKPPLVATFSIVARDPKTEELGVAVQSRVLAVGAIVPWAKAGIGAVATQALANPTYGPKGLDLLAQGKAADEVVKLLTEADSGRDDRQLGVLAADGRAATFTGASCLDWAGGRTGENYTVQGNILEGKAVVDAMAEAFEKTGGELGARLLAALDAGQQAGGDRRGKQSAALLIVRKGWGYGGMDDRFRDLRVDDHPEPIRELRRIYEKAREMFPQPE